jgi:hypothetical protein
MLGKKNLLLWLGAKAVPYAHGGAFYPVEISRFLFFVTETSVVYPVKVRAHTVDSAFHRVRDAHTVDVSVKKRETVKFPPGKRLHRVHKAVPYAHGGAFYPVEISRFLFFVRETSVVYPVKVRAHMVQSLTPILNKVQHRQMYLRKYIWYGRTYVLRLRTYV